MLMSLLEQYYPEIVRMSHLVGNPVERSVANKALDQVVLLDRGPLAEPREVEGLDIGLFRLLESQATNNWATDSGRFCLNAGDRYLDFHMPVSESVAVEAATKSYQEIANFVKNDPAIVAVVGVTYRVMALSAVRRHGFSSEELTLPPAIMDLARAYWQELLPNAKPSQFDTAHIVWHTRQSFLDTFA